MIIPSPEIIDFDSSHKLVNIVSTPNQEELI
jgi:hypothetical protein